ncbi:protein kinase C-binding protein NELL2-like [Sycon ciliatum]|uniref:protein kinase C-binding protein NELL2-like n=1 Tax=Sycon ciliatum TaxID=27933 RepID=UPI0031F69B47
MDNGVSLNLRLCALKIPTDYSKGNILKGVIVKNYVSANLTKATCQQKCNIISSLDNCSLCAGYLFNYTCLDRDECLHQTHNCSSNAACTNTVGSYNCTCDSGFSGDGKFCKDRDECLYQTHNCSSNATCANTVGSYNCTCDSGFSGDGTSCKGMLQLFFYSSYPR